MHGVHGVAGSNPVAPTKIFSTMFDPLIIIVTITFLIIVFIAYWIRIPYAIIPLGFIYLVFIIFSREPQIKTNSSSNNLINSNSTNLNSNPNTSKDAKLLISNIKPKPLVFDSGRTSKDYSTNFSKNNTKNIPKPNILEPEKKIKPKNPEKLLSVKDIQICQFIKNRNPIGSNTYFSDNVDSLFCFTRMENSGGKQEVVHLWYYEDKIVGKIKYNIKRSKNYRSWTKKTILASQIGPWRVDVQDTSGTVIASKFFFITDN